MTPDRTEPVDIASYRQSLIMALRLKDVPGDRIGEIVAEVESHVADTGEDPVDAFGPARDYAAGLSDEHRPEPRWHTALSIAAAAASGFLLAQGALALLLGQTFLNRSGWLWIAIGLVITIPAAIRVHRRSARVRDPRTGADMVPTSRWGVVALVGIPLAIVLMGWLIAVLAT